MKKLIFACFLVFVTTTFLCEPLKRIPFNQTLFSKKDLASSYKKEVILRDLDSGRENGNNPPPFDFAEGEKVINEAQEIINSGRVDSDIKEKLEKSLEQYKAIFYNYKNLSQISVEQTIELMDLKYSVQNNIGLACKGKKSLKSKRFAFFNEKKEIVPISESDASEKVGTGWIIDQKIYDSTVEKWYPTIPSDIRSNDEGASDTEVDDDGWVWHVQSFYFSDPLLDENQQPTHANPSYCLAVFLSPDGGPTWYLYEVLYDPDGIDLINPRLAIDILPSTNRFFIAYEYAYSETDHDIYVYSEDFSSTPNSQDAAIATSTLMERNPDIASDFYQGQTSYRVVVWEQEASAGSYNYDIYASQSTGAGATSDWTSAVGVAVDANPEKNPSISHGASGYSSITQYMHLAYNYTLYSSSQLLLNNGFESGNNGNWTVQNAEDIDCSSGYQRTGSCFAWFGGLNNYTGYIYQDVYVPSNASSANFSYYIKIQSDEGTTTAYDFFYVQLRDASNNLLTTLKSYSNKDKNTYSSYTLQSFDILPYAGQTLRIYMYGTTDSSLITSFFIDDTSLDVSLPSGYEVRYARAQHPGGTPYPNGLQSFSKITVLSNVGADWEYGPPSVVATHGGTSTMTTARVVVAADQHFPVDKPNSGDLERHQICFAWSMCNGGTSCGTMTCGSDTLSKNWQEGWFYDARGDERYPSLIQDGAGLPTKGLDIHPYIYMAYFHRTADEPTGLGEIQLILTIPYDETCDGFIQGWWYYFTNSYKATDPKNLVSPKPRTINAFNYWDGYPGITFNKYISHPIGGSNDDIYCTTIGDNYTFNTYSSGDYLDLVVSLDQETYSTPHTFPWAAGYKWDIIAVTPQEESPYHYDFSNWSNSQTDPKITVVSDYCDPVNPCPEVNFTASYNRCIMSIPEVQNCLAIRNAQNSDYVDLSWNIIQDVSQYAIYEASNPSSKSNFKLLTTTTSNSFTDTTSTTPGVYYYIVVGKCSSYEGQWGGSYDQ